MNRVLVATLIAAAALAGTAALAAEQPATEEPTLFERVFGRGAADATADATAKRDQTPARPIYDAGRYDLDPRLIDWLQRLRTHPEGR